MRMCLLNGCCALMATVSLSCVDYAPKPRGYMRIEPQAPCYQVLDLPELPFLFEVSQAVTIELPETMAQPMFNLSYPDMHAKLYCSYLPITRISYPEAEAESRRLVARAAGATVASIQERAYAHPEVAVYGSLFLLPGDAASPVQFLLTDSVAHFLRGALYFDCRPNADSLAPAIDYIRQDMMEMMQTFRWRR